MRLMDCSSSAAHGRYGSFASILTHPPQVSLDANLGHGSRRSDALVRAAGGNFGVLGSTVFRSDHVAGSKATSDHERVTPYYETVSLPASKPY
jgi:hypothetical protein